MRELHIEGAASLGHRTQINGITEELRLGRLRLNQAFSLPNWLHAKHASAFAVQIPDHIAHAVLRHLHFYIANRLQQNRLSLQYAFFQSHAASYLKSHFRRIHCMIRAIIQSYFYIHKRKASQYAAHHGVAHAFFYCGNILSGHRAAKNRINEFKIPSRRQGI